MGARVKYGALITEVKGSIGGQTFQSCRGGFILRNKPISPKNRSFSQSSIRSVNAKNGSSWRGLSQAERDSWNAVAPSYPHTDKFGDPATLSGYELYMRANFYLALVGVTLLSSGALPDALWSPASVSITSSVAASEMDLVWTGGNVGADMRALIRLSPPLSAGRSYRKSDLVIVLPITSGTSSPLDLWSEVIKRYGVAPVAGQRFFASMQVVSTVTGNVSQLYNASAIIQA